jgi:hypothetical protein
LLVSDLVRVDGAIDTLEAMRMSTGKGDDVLRNARFTVGDQALFEPAHLVERLYLAL